MKLSIITINYNNCEGLRKTIDSVINQTWQDFEWIIVDGGSTDGSRELIVQTAVQLESQGWKTEQFSGPEDPAAYIAEHPLSEQQDTPHSSLLTPHCLQWCSEKDKGIYNAMNKGIVRAQGEYCLFLNSGDCLYKNNTLTIVFERELHSDFECYDMFVKQNNNNVKFISKIKYNNIPAHYLINDALPHQASFIKRTLFSTIGFYDETLKIVSDWKFEIIAIIFHSATLSYHSLKFAEVQPEGISQKNFELRQKERSMVLQSLFPELVLKDYEMLHSLVEVYESSPLCRKLYSLLYRLADYINRRKIVK